MQVQQIKTTKKNSNAQLPPIPDKRFFTIGEVSKLCHIKPHVLRYWEQEFEQLSPAKRRGNRRYYEREEVILIREIQHLLYDNGFTISGARKQLAKKTKQEVKTDSSSVQEEQQTIIQELQEILDILNS